MKESEFERVSNLILNKQAITNIIDKVEAMDVCLVLGNYGARGALFHDLTTLNEVTQASHNVRHALKAMVVIELQRALKKINENLEEFGLELGK